MTTEERKKIIIFTWLKIIRDILLAFSIIKAFYGEFIQTGIFLIAYSVLNAFYNGLPFTIFWGLCGIGIFLLGYEKREFAMAPLALAVMIMATDIILWIRAIKRYGMRGLLRIKITDRHKIYARRDFYEENEITCILWRKLKQKQISEDSRIGVSENVLKTERPLTIEERKKFTKFLMAGLIILLLVTSAMVCILYDKFIWMGILFIAMGIVNTYFLGLSFTIALILGGLSLISVGYEKRGLAIIFGAFGIAIIIANIILMQISIARGALERLETLSKFDRFAFINDYLRKNDITCILFDKMKHRLNWNNRKW